MKQPEQPQNIEQNGYPYFHQDRTTETSSSEDQLKQRISEFLEIICIDVGAPLRDRLIRWLGNGQDIPREERLQHLVQTMKPKNTEEDLTQRMKRMSLHTPPNSNWNYQGQQPPNPIPLPDYAMISTSSYVTTVAPTWQSGQLVSTVWWEGPETTSQIHNTGSNSRNILIGGSAKTKDKRILRNNMHRRWCTITRPTYTMVGKWTRHS